MQQIVESLGDLYEPDPVVIAAAQGAGAFDPMALSETYLSMAASMLQLANKHCGGRLIAVHEGYSPWHVPFLLRAVVAELAGLPALNDPYMLYLRDLPGQQLTSCQRDYISELSKRYLARFVKIHTTNLHEA